MVHPEDCGYKSQDGHAKREGYNHATQKWLLPLARNSILTILVAQLAQQVSQSVTVVTNFTAGLKK